MVSGEGGSRGLCYGRRGSGGVGFVERGGALSLEWCFVLRGFCIFGGFFSGCIESEGMIGYDMIPRLRAMGSRISCLAGVLFWFSSSSRSINYPSASISISIIIKAFFKPHNDVGTLLLSCFYVI